MYHQAILWSSQEKSLELGSYRLKMRVMQYSINIQKNSIVYYKHFFRRQLLPVKKVYEIPTFSIFKNANDAASHHSGLRVGQQGYKFWATLASGRLTRE